MRDLVRFAVRDEAAQKVLLPKVDAVLASLPDDARPKLGEDTHGTFRRLHQSVSTELAEAYYESARAVSTLLAEPPYLTKLVGPCAADATANADACIDGFIRRFGERALRGELGEDQVALYRRVYGDASQINPAAVADVVAVMLTSARLLYFVEHGRVAVPGRPGVYGLTAQELATRLSYHFWDTLPDDELWEAARTGALLTADGFRRQLDRVVADPRARSTVDQFAIEWMMLEDLEGLDNLKDDPSFKVLAGADLPKPALRGAMIEDALDLFRHYLWRSPGSYDDLLTSDHVFPRDPALAAIYGVAQVWDGKSAPPSVAAGTRPGYLTRAAMLASAAVRTRPIIRGAVMRTKTLCDDIPAPPPEAAALAEEAEANLSPGLSARERTVALTETLGPACAVCHVNLINPLGFALEAYDTLGRLRTEELVFGPKPTEPPKRVPVRTRTSPRVLSGDETAAEGPSDLVRLIQSSGKAHACFARHYVRFSLGRAEDVARDACAIAAVSAALTKRAPLTDVLKAMALSPAFHQHNFGDLH